MLHKLSFSVEFPATGQKFSGDHDFSTGLTTISGPNERGKSLRLEFIRYALFGTKALRAPATNYKNLSVSLTFVVNSVTYAVTRHKNKAYVQQNGTTLANGGTATNRKVIEILGFDLKVFDVTNACPQGEVEALGNMRPAERKHLVDQTVGLTTIDQVAERLKELANAEKRNAESIEKWLVEPAEPTVPEDYEPSDKLEAKLPEVQQMADELQQLHGWLSADGPAEPVYPQCPTPDTVETLQAHQETRQQALAEKNRLEKSIAEIPTTQYTKQEVDELEDLLHRHERWKKKQEIDNIYPAPSHAEADLQSMAAAWDKINLIDTLYKDIARLEEQGEHTCSNCGHTEPLQKGKIDDLFAQMPSERPTEPSLSEREISKQLQRVQAYKQRPTDYDDAVQAAKPKVDIDEMRRAVERADERKRLQEELDALTVPEDRSDDLKARQRYEEEVRNFHQRKAEYDTYMEKRRQAEERLEQLKGADHSLKALNARIAEAKTYEANYESYLKEVEKYQQQADEARAHRHREDQYKRAKEAMALLKARIKQHLVPSLNKVASHLLSQMTNGERSVVHIKDDFEIDVDGQPLSTLSGSGKAVTNLAVRIALGQVLTNRVLSTFIGDEIDAAMDEDRANFTADCLNNLQSNVDQIILITHKATDSDQMIRL